MLEINKTKLELKKDWKLFVWEFKVGDNISYNLDILYNLIEDYNNQNKDYKKPISIIAISIIEAIMVDFLYRLYKATKHFPENLRQQEENIKNKLNNNKVKAKFLDSEGKERYYFVLENFNSSSMVKVYKDLKLLGSNEKKYESLLELFKFRNRIHINNYFNNFEKDEEITFSENRTQKTINIMLWFFSYYKENYKRNWPENK